MQKTKSSEIFMELLGEQIFSRHTVNEAILQLSFLVRPTANLFFCGSGQISMSHSFHEFGNLTRKKFKLKFTSTQKIKAFVKIARTLTNIRARNLLYFHFYKLPQNRTSYTSESIKIYYFLSLLCSNILNPYLFKTSILTSFCMRLYLYP